MDIKQTIKVQTALEVISKIRQTLEIQSVQQMEVFLSVAAEEGQSQKEIGDASNLDAKTMANLIPVLRRKKVIHDYVKTGRTKGVDMTPEARRVMDTI